jgi:hypothetical protein
MGVLWKQLAVVAGVIQVQCGHACLSPGIAKGFSSRQTLALCISMCSQSVNINMFFLCAVHTVCTRVPTTHSTTGQVWKQEHTPRPTIGN